MARSDLGRPCAGCCGTRTFLGFRPGTNAHIFDALGVRLPRKEETEEYVDHAYPHVAVQKSLFERAWDKGEEEKEDLEQVEGEVLMCSGKGHWVGEEGDWVPVRRDGAQEPLFSPAGDAPVEVVPGLWDQRSTKG